MKREEIVEGITDALTRKAIEESILGYDPDALRAVCREDAEAALAWLESQGLIKPDR